MGQSLGKQFLQVHDRYASLELARQHHRTRAGGPVYEPQERRQVPPSSSSSTSTDLFDLDMYLEASLAINTSIDLGICSLEEESGNPFEDTFAVLEPDPEPVITLSPESSAIPVPMNRSVKERDVYRPSGYTPFEV